MSRNLADRFRYLLCVLFSLLLWDCVLAQQTSTTTSTGTRSRIRTVFLNLTGDQKFAHRLWTFLDFELEDIGVSLANTEVEADAVVNGKVSAGVHKQNFALGVVRLRTTVKGQTTDQSFCASMSTDENAAVFDTSGDDVGDKVREKYPSASSLAIDSASDMTKSERFKDALMRSLRNSNFKVVTSPSPDIALHVDLVPEKVPIEENVVTYEIAVVAKDGTLLYSSSGSGVLSAVATVPAPQECPREFLNLDWVANSNSLPSTARMLAQQLKKQNTAILNPPAKP